MNLKKSLAIFIIGVSGVGKSTIGELASNELSIPFFDGDDYHPKENVKKMAQGQPLTDEDRYEWLINLNQLARKQIQQNSCIIACSALKESYRDLLKKDIETQIKWIFLNGSFEQISDRLKQRKGHFMPLSLLKSQFESLEIPIDAQVIDISKSPNKITGKIVNDLMKKSEFGLIGLGVMGKSLARNLASKNITLSLFNRHVINLEENIALNFIESHSELSSALAFDNLTAFVNSLQTPRKIMLMVNAGNPVDDIIDKLTPLLSENDVIIDGGNSHYSDTQRRIDTLHKHKLHFIGAGISGGEEGALKGPSIMPGGNLSAYKMAKPFLESIAAKDQNNKPCCTFIGTNGSGHFTKMVHNGIEYVEMQLLAEIYFILKKSNKNPDEIASLFESWKTTSNSYLLEITIDILRKKEGNDWLIDKILDVSGSKGTGNWTTITTTKLGVPSTMIPTALFARYISSLKEERVRMNKIYKSKTNNASVDTNDLLSAYHLSRIINHHQGFNLLYQASKSYDWNLNLSEIARIWTNGCIIRSSFMEQLVDLLKEGPNVLLNHVIVSQVKILKPSLNKIVSQSILEEIPIPCLSEATNFLNAYTRVNSSANMIQAQRDFFGAHKYQRVDDASGTFYHTNW